MEVVPVKKYQALKEDYHSLKTKYKSALTETEEAEEMKEKLLEIEGARDRFRNITLD